jgi:hypothetical protein
MYVIVGFAVLCVFSLVKSDNMVMATILWTITVSFVLSCGFNRLGLSMIFPIAAPLFLLSWYYKKEG